MGPTLQGRARSRHAEGVNSNLAALPRRGLGDTIGQALAEASPWQVAALLIVWSLAIRCALFGNPLIDHDDEFFLLVGDRMLHGALPYVDIWDRKPIGLFLLYAAIRTLGGEGIVQYQLVACLFAALTALLIWRMARKIAEPAPALIAALVYLTFSVLFNGAGGEAPVFYNLLVALAALILLEMPEWPWAERPAALGAAGCATMLLVGIAIQIKYTVMFEGLFFGLLLMRRARRLPLAQAGALTLAWIACALLPTAAATLAYYGMGHGDAFVQANFVSIFYRQEPKLPAFGRLAVTLMLLAPLLYCAWRGWRRPLAQTPAKARGFLAAWCGAAIAGYLVFGTYYDHYALPVLVPLSVLAGIGFTAPGAAIGARVTLAFAVVAALGAVALRIHVTGTARQLAPLSRMVRANLDGCLFVYEGEPILYHTSKACTVSRFVFPSHLNAAKEQGALGVDARAETQRILAQRPSVIVTSDHARPADTNFATRRLVMAAIARDYEPAGEALVGVHRWLVYRRRR